MGEVLMEPPAGYRLLADYAREIGCHPDVAKRAAQGGRVADAVRVQPPGAPVPVWWVPESATWRPKRVGRPEKEEPTVPCSVVIPVSPYGREQWLVHLTSTSRQWERLHAGYSRNGVIRLPDDQFDGDKAVPDEVRYEWKGGSLYLVPRPRPVRPGAVVIILESPHQHEYTLAFTPIGPLQKPASRTRLRNYLPGLLREAQVPDDVDVVLVNPIQYQTSLHRLHQPMYQAGVSTAIRDAVWKALWGLEVADIMVYQRDFLNRMDKYQPSLVINSCTAGVKGIVDEVLKSNGYPVVGVTQHPSYWSSKTKLVRR